MKSSIPSAWSALARAGMLKARSSGRDGFNPAIPFGSSTTWKGLPFLYAVTSHSRDDDGNEKKSREELVRFRIEGERVVGPVVVNGLKPALVAAYPLLAAAAQIADAKSGGGLNIEALEISPDRQRLLIGFRSPLEGSLAIIASVENPLAVFEADAAP